MDLIVCKGCYIHVSISMKIASPVLLEISNFMSHNYIKLAKEVLVQEIF